MTNNTRAILLGQETARPNSKSTRKADEITVSLLFGHGYRRHLHQIVSSQKYPIHCTGNQMSVVHIAFVLATYMFVHLQMRYRERY